MKIEYVYKKEHQEILDKVEAAINQYQQDYEERVTEWCKDTKRYNMGVIPMRYLEPQKSSAQLELEEELVYLKSILTPIKVIIKGEDKEVIV